MCHSVCQPPSELEWYTRGKDYASRGDRAASKAVLVVLAGQGVREGEGDVVIHD